LQFEPGRERGLFAHRGRSVLEVHEDPGYGDACVERAAEVTATFLETMGLRPAGVDLLIASPYPAAFAAGLARAAGISADRLPELPPELERAHTAGPIAVLAAAMEAGSFARAR